MYEKDKIKLDAISGIDEEIVDKATAIRWSWMINLGNKVRRSNFWLRIVAVAACFCLMVGGGIVVFLKFFNGQSPNEPSAPIVTTERQVPIYTGMSVQKTKPTVEARATAMSLTQLSSGVMGLNESRVALLHHSSPDQSDPYERGEHGPKLEDAVKDRFKLQVESVQSDYFAEKNEDVYFVIHIDNPDNFEILSFTINGTKYSSYMFEDGSNMETLILKYNVGDVEGTQEYTIDAIKYIDGDQIKDVRMDGEQTVRVHIYPEEQPMATVASETLGFFDISFVVNISDPKALISASEGKLYGVLYDGETIIAEKEIQNGEPVLFDGLLPETLYQYAVVAVYDAIDGEGTKAHVLIKKAVYTDQVLSLTASPLSGVNVSFHMSWNKNYMGEKQLLSFGLYQGNKLLRELSPSDTLLEKLPFDKSMSLRATYTAGELQITKKVPIESPQTSEGLKIKDGVLTGIGTCEDTVLYINHSVADGALRGHKKLTAVYFGEGVKSVGDNAFLDCTVLEEVYFAEGIQSIGERAFNFKDAYFEPHSAIETLSLPASLTSVGAYAFGERNVRELTFACRNCTLGTGWLYPSGDSTLTTVIFAEGVTRVPSNIFSFNQTAIKYIHISSTVSNIDTGSLAGSSALERITVAEGNRYYQVKGNCLISSWSGILVLGCKNSVIPTDGSVTRIGNSAFKNCVGLTEIVIPNTVQRIYDHAFEACPSLKNIYFTGTQEEWENIEKTIYSDIPDTATIHFNYVPQNS